VAGVPDGRHNDFGWGTMLAKKNGCQSYMYAIPGITTDEWYNEPVDGPHRAQYATYGKTKLLEDAPKNLYCIMLGINDTIDGTIADCKADYTQNGNSWYGYYGGVIGSIASHAPNSKIICIVPPQYASTHAKSIAIHAVADFYGVPCFNASDDPFFSSEFYTSNLSTGHPVAMTYSGMTLAMERLIVKCVVDNDAYFKDYNGLTTN
jgi:hypothetical protein